MSGKSSRLVMSSRKSEDWSTPRAVMEALQAEFGFTMDACPLGAVRHDLGLLRSWAGERVYCNPPYGLEIRDWMAKGREADLAVYLVPARTDTKWWHEIVLPYATEVRFIRGRLRSDGRRAGWPFPTVIIVFVGPGLPGERYQLPGVTLSARPRFTYWSVPK